MDIVVQASAWTYVFIFLDKCVGVELLGHGVGL